LLATLVVFSARNPPRLFGTIVLALVVTRVWQPE
jgi:hypothetical protein